MPALYTRPGEYEIQKIEAKLDVVPYPSGKPNEWYITLYLTITAKALRDLPSSSAYSIEERGGVLLAGRTVAFVRKYFLSGARAGEIRTETVVTDRYFFTISLPYKTEIIIPTFDNLRIPITINPPPTPSVVVLEYKPPELVLISASVTPSEVIPGQATTVKAIVKNIGTVRGSFTVNFSFYDGFSYISPPAVGISRTYEIWEERELTWTMIAPEYPEKTARLLIRIDGKEIPTDVFLKIKPRPGTKYCEKEGKYIPETEWSESRCVPVAVPAPTAAPTAPTIFEQYPLLLPIILIGAVGIGAYFLLKK
jgi:hypothetical protein